jgi:hypothetical protein
MAVPPIGTGINTIVTPSNFVIMSAQFNVVLNWSPAPLATIYYVNRSIDNITFTNIGNTVSVQYNDSTAVVGTIYYYTIQAATASYSSIPTYSLSGQALNPGQTTVANMRLECQQRTDRVNSDNISNQEWNSMINQSWKEFYDIIIQKFGDDYYIALPVSYVTTGQVDPITQAQTFPLPVDFYKLMRCEVALNANDPNSWITLRQFQAIQANLWNYPNVYTFYGITNLRYRLWGTNLQIVPIASAGQTIRIWYSPRPNQLINDTDVIDAISGYEEYIVVDTCIKALAKTEEDAQMFLLQKAALLKRIEEAAENRNVGEPQQVSDSRTRNFAWTDSSGEFGSGSGMW